MKTTPSKNPLVSAADLLLAELLPGPGLHAQAPLHQVRQALGHAHEDHDAAVAAGAGLPPAVQQLCAELLSLHETGPTVGVVAGVGTVPGQPAAQLTRLASQGSSVRQGDSH